MSGCNDKKTDTKKDTSEINSKSEYIESTSKNNPAENTVTKSEKSEINTVSNTFTDMAVKSTTVPENTTSKTEKSDIEEKSTTSKQENAQTQKNMVESTTIVTTNSLPETAIQTHERDENELPEIDPFA